MGLVKPWLWLPAQLSHDLSHLFLRVYGQVAKPQTPNWNALTWRGLYFPNRLGIAAGIDKNAELVNAFWALGCGFVEVGTITPHPQPPNPGKILDRSRSYQALWNSMGFPSKGLQTVKKNLSVLRPRLTPIFVNIGKNRSTPNELAFTDYSDCLLKLSPVADVFVINISSPNTADLREIQKPKFISQFLKQSLAEYRNQKQQPTRPILLKLSPDLSEPELASALEASIEQNIDGWVLGNTTSFRPQGLKFPKEGGLSGAPLAQLAKAQLRRAINLLGHNRQHRLIVSVGGVLSPKEVDERLALGADLVQVYSALVFNGPFFFKKTARYFSK